MRSNSVLRSEAKTFFKANRGKVLDVLLYGSSVKGKLEPEDVDLLVLFAGRADEHLAHDLEKDLKVKGFSADVKAKSWSELFETSFLAREAILSEAVSLINGKPLHSLFGYVSFALFKYSLAGLAGTQRVRFHYALRGRNSAGFLEKVGGIKFTDSSVLVPTENADEFSSFLNNWKLDSSSVFVLVPEKSLEGWEK